MPIWDMVDRIVILAIYIGTCQCQLAFAENLKPLLVILQFLSCNWHVAAISAKYKEISAPGHCEKRELTWN